MPLTLHAAFVPSALQMLGTTRHLLDTAESWCRDQGRAPESVIGARIHPDMFPFAYQIKSVAAHTAGALEALAGGVFSPHMEPPPQDFAGLRERIAAATSTVESANESELESRIGAPMQFRMGEFVMDFTAENFLLSFSQPNFYFHAATAYDILRMLGAPVGKRDYMGRMRRNAG